jgi:hypothetical protein
MDGNCGSAGRSLHCSTEVLDMAIRRRMEQDPAVAGFTDAEIDRAIERAQQRMQEDPHTGLRRWLLALKREKYRRNSQRG